MVKLEFRNKKKEIMVVSTLAKGNIQTNWYIAMHYIPKGGVVTKAKILEYF